MKDRLEDFIQKNRGEFDVNSPSPEIWRRIHAQIQKPVRARKFIHTIMKIAAAIALFALSYAYHEYRDTAKSRIAETSLDENIYTLLPELREAEFYYNNQVELKMKELQPLFATIPEIKTNVSLDFAELDSTYSVLKKDLIENIANDEVLEAMIQNYRLKLQILEDLLSWIKKENNTETYENTKIRI